MMDFDASITYRQTVSPNALRAIDASRGQQLIGLRCPICGRTYTGGRGFCPVDAVELGPEHEVELSQTGTVTNYTIITPVQYPGQTETEPFVRAMVLLDPAEDDGAATGPDIGADRSRDVILGYQPLLDMPGDEVRVGMRVTRAVASAGGARTGLGGHGRHYRIPGRLDAHRRARRQRPRPREPDLLMSTTDHSGPDDIAIIGWTHLADGAPAPTRPKPSCSSR